jgi:hypothetical protein
VRLRSFSYQCTPTTGLTSKDDMWIFRLGGRVGGRAGGRAGGRRSDVALVIEVYTTTITTTTTRQIGKLRANRLHTVVRVRVNRAKVCFVHPLDIEGIHVGGHEYPTFWIIPVQSRDGRDLRRVARPKHGFCTLWLLAFAIGPRRKLAHNVANALLHDGSRDDGKTPVAHGAIQHRIQQGVVADRGYPDETEAGFRDATCGRDAKVSDELEIITTPALRDCTGDVGSDFRTSVFPGNLRRLPR